jgi:hypothetical protein
MLHTAQLSSQGSRRDAVCAVAGCLPADDPGTPYSRRSDKSSSEPGDVELIERNTNDSSAYGEQPSTCTAAIKQQKLEESSAAEHQKHLVT